MAQLTPAGEDEAKEQVKTYGVELRNLACQIAKSRGSSEATNRDIQDATVHYKNKRTVNTAYVMGCVLNLAGGAGVGAILQDLPTKGFTTGLFIFLAAAVYVFGEVLKDKR